MVENLVSADQAKIVQAVVEKVIVARILLGKSPRHLRRLRKAVQIRKMMKTDKMKMLVK